MTRPIQCVQFTLRTEYDSVTIDGKTYTTPELRAALSTTPDQGDERRAMTAAYLAFCADKAPDHNEVGFPYFKAAWEARVAQPVAQAIRIGALGTAEIYKAQALAAPQPSQGVEPVAYLMRRASGTTWALAASEMTDDVRRAFEMDDIEIIPLAAPHPPVSAEAGKGDGNG